MRLTRSLLTALCLLWIPGAAGATGLLVRVDFQQPGNNNGVPTSDIAQTTTQSASFADDGTNFWNAVEKSVGALPSQLLKNSDAPSGLTVATLDILGLNFTAGRQGSADPLQHDFIGVTNLTPVSWEISGLVSNASYELALYAGQDDFGLGNNTSTRFSIDTDGDGALDTTLDIAFLAGSTYLPAIVSDAGGVIRGTFAQVPGADPGTGTWSGFQLAGPVAIPEPSSALLLGLGLAGLARLRTASRQGGSKRS